MKSKVKNKSKAQEIFEDKDLRMQLALAIGNSILNSTNGDWRVLTDSCPYGTCGYSGTCRECWDDFITKSFNQKE